MSQIDDIDKLLHAEVMAHRLASSTDASRPEWYRARIDALYRVKAVVDHMEPVVRPVTNEGDHNDGT